METSNLIFECSDIDRIVFHYNKQHNVNVEVPPWVIKHKGHTYYIHHLDMEPGVGFSTKETPQSDNTKGAIQFRGRLKIINEQNKIVATIF